MPLYMEWPSSLLYMVTGQQQPVATLQWIKLASHYWLKASVFVQKSMPYDAFLDIHIDFLSEPHKV